MAPDALFSVSAASVVEDVLRLHGKKLSDRDLASRKAEEIGIDASLSLSLVLQCWN